MIEVYSWPTPNGHKVHIMLEECGLAYRAIPVDIGAGAQFEPKFLSISPNNKIPAIVDPDGPDGKPISLFESGAILLYLAAKVGRFLPASTRGKYEVLQWLMFQMGSVGPMLGQAHHFRIYAPEKIDYAINRYTSETNRLYGVLNKRLAPNSTSRALSSISGLRRLDKTSTPRSTAGRLPISSNQPFRCGKSFQSMPWFFQERSQGKMAMSAMLYSGPPMYLLAARRLFRTPYRRLVSLV